MCLEPLKMQVLVTISVGSVISAIEILSFLLPSFVLCQGGTNTEVRGQLLGVSSLLPWWSQGLNSGHQAWQKSTLSRWASLPTCHMPFSKSLSPSLCPLFLHLATSISSCLSSLFESYLVNFKGHAGEANAGVLKCVHQQSKWLFKTKLMMLQNDKLLRVTDPRGPRGFLRMQSGTVRNANGTYPHL